MTEPPGDGGSPIEHEDVERIDRALANRVTYAEGRKAVRHIWIGVIFFALCTAGVLYGLSEKSEADDRRAAALVATAEREARIVQCEEGKEIIALATTLFTREADLIESLANEILVGREARGEDELAARVDKILAQAKANQKQVDRINEIAAERNCQRIP